MRDRTEATDTFLQGYAASLADLCRLGCPDLAARMMRDTELCPDSFASAGVEESDLEELRAAIAGDA